MVQSIVILSTARISLYPPTSLHVNGLVIFRHLRFAGTCRIADAAEELTKTAAVFDQPAIFAVRAGRIICTAGTSNLAGPLGVSWQGRAAGWAGRAPRGRAGSPADRRRAARRLGPDGSPSFR